VAYSMVLSRNSPKGSEQNH